MNSLYIYLCRYVYVYTYASRGINHASWPVAYHQVTSRLGSVGQKCWVQFVGSKTLHHQISV